MQRHACLDGVQPRSLASHESHRRASGCTVDTILDHVTWSMWHGPCFVLQPCGPFCVGGFPTAEKSSHLAASSSGQGPSQPTRHQRESHEPQHEDPAEVQMHVSDALSRQQIWPPTVSRTNLSWDVERGIKHTPTHTTRLVRVGMLTPLRFQGCLVLNIPCCRRSGISGLSSSSSRAISTHYQLDHFKARWSRWTSQRRSGTTTTVTDAQKC